MGYQEREGAGPVLCPPMLLVLSAEPTRAPVVTKTRGGARGWWRSMTMITQRAPARGPAPPPAKWRPQPPPVLAGYIIAILHAAAATLIQRTPRSTL